MAFVGTCQEMCPEKERQARFGLYMSIFEKDQNNQPDESAMVKEYRRSGADQEEPSPQDLRTVAALELTMDHLVSRIMDDPRSSLPDTSIEWYDFLWDRLRALRKDITQQNICDHRTALLVEKCARFHVHSCYAMNRVKDFDVDMNKRNLNDCLQMLRQMYSDLRTTSGTICSGEMEFQKYDILLHLNDDQLSSTILMKTSDHRDSEDMKFLFRVFSAYANNDYYKFFQLMEQADYMTSCILSLYANRMRLLGLRTIAHACSSARQNTLYPIDMAVKCLAFDSTEDFRSFAESIGVGIQSKEEKEYAILSKDLVVTIRRAEENIQSFRSYRLVEKKMQESTVGKLVYGGDVILPVHVPRTVNDNTAPMEADNDDFPIESETSNWFQNTQSNPLNLPRNSWFPNTNSDFNSRPSVFQTQPAVTHLNSTFNVPNSKLEPIRSPDAHSGSGKQVSDRPFSFGPLNGATKPSSPKLLSESQSSSDISHRSSSLSSDGSQSVTAVSKPSSRFRGETPSEDQVLIQSTSTIQNNPSATNNIEYQRSTIEQNDINEEAIVDDLKHLEQQVVALENQTVADYDVYVETIEPGINEFLARAIRKRANMTRDQLADRMPAGRFQSVPLALKRPTLRLPDGIPPQQVESAPKRRKMPRQNIESISSRIQDEEKVNKIFQELANMITR